MWVQLRKYIAHPVQWRLEQPCAHGDVVSVLLRALLPPSPVIPPQPRHLRLLPDGVGEGAGGTFASTPTPTSSGHVASMVISLHIQGIIQRLIISKSHRVTLVTALLSLRTTKRGGGQLRPPPSVLVSSWTRLCVHVMRTKKCVLDDVYEDIDEFEETHTQHEHDGQSVAVNAVQIHQGPVFELDVLVHYTKILSV